MTTFDDIFGRSATLTIRRFSTPGAFLAIDASDTRSDAPTILLIGREIPEGAKEGDQVRVFIHLDSEGRPIATTRVPKLELGQVAFLEVTNRTNFGAFVDWGLDKELLVPFVEQTVDMEVGGWHFVGLYIDQTQRLAGTMKVGEMVGGKVGDFTAGEWVEGEAWRNNPEIGLFVIVERQFVGLVPASEPHALRRGQAARFRVANVLPDGRIELSLRGRAHEELDNDAAQILAKLTRAGAPKVGDRSSPEEIRAIFGLSKKAFKRAAGRLLKEGSVAVDNEGFLVIAAASKPRGPRDPR